MAKSAGSRFSWKRVVVCVHSLFPQMALSIATANTVGFHLSCWASSKKSFQYTVMSALQIRALCLLQMADLMSEVEGPASAMCGKLNSIQFDWIDELALELLLLLVVVVVGVSAFDALKQQTKFSANVNGFVYVAVPRTGSRLTVVDSHRRRNIKQLTQSVNHNRIVVL